MKFIIEDTQYIDIKSIIDNRKSIIINKNIIKKEFKPSELFRIYLLKKLNFKIKKMDKSLGELKDKYNKLLKESNEYFHRKEAFRKLGVKYGGDPPSKKNMNGYVYFIMNNLSGLIKIGWSTDPYNRLKFLQTCSAGKLILLGAFEGTIKNEKQHHKLMKEKNIYGEWFDDYDGKIKEYIKEKNILKYECE